MATTRIDSVDTTLQKTNEWLEGVADGLGAGRRKTAYVALRAVLHALRDRLATGAAVRRRGALATRAAAR